MKKKSVFLRPAIAMIELIFAIVVMGIVMLSVPQLLSTASKSGYVAIQQEAINEASTQVNIIMGYDWDENNTQNGNKPILATTNGNIGLQATGDLHFKGRAGTPSQSHRNLFLGGMTSLSASTISQDPNDMGDIDDIDDFSGITRTLFLEENNAGTSDYIEKKTIALGSTVSYVSDTMSNGTYSDPGADNNLTFDLNTTAFPIGQTTNIKHIQVTLTSNAGVDELSKNITLHAFSCNIGTYKLKEKQ